VNYDWFLGDEQEVFAFLKGLFTLMKSHCEEKTCIFLPSPIFATSLSERF
jgi:hypothetical protein